MSARRVDIAALAADSHEDAWEAMAESYAFIAGLLIAVLQQVGPRTLPPDALERAEGFVVTTDWVGDHGAMRLAVSRREDVTDMVESSEEAAARLRKRWEAQYPRRGGGS